MITLEQQTLTGGVCNVTVMAIVKSGSNKIILRMVKTLKRATPEAARKFMRAASKEFVINILTRYVNQRKKSLIAGSQFIEVEELAVKTIETLIAKSENQSVFEVMRAVVKHERSITRLFPSDNSRFLIWTYVMPELIAWAKENQF